MKKAPIKRWSFDLDRLKEIIEYLKPFSTEFDNIFIEKNFEVRLESLQGGSNVLSRNIEGEGPNGSVDGGNNIFSISVCVRIAFCICVSVPSSLSTMVPLAKLRDTPVSTYIPHPISCL
jgi:hypothetical protein